MVDDRLHRRIARDRNPRIRLPNRGLNAGGHINIRRAANRKARAKPSVQRLHRRVWLLLKRLVDQQRRRLSQRVRARIAYHPHHHRRAHHLVAQRIDILPDFKSSPPHLLPEPPPHPPPRSAHPLVPSRPIPPPPHRSPPHRHNPPPPP